MSCQMHIYLHKGNERRIKVSERNSNVKETNKQRRSKASNKETKTKKNLQSAQFIMTKTVHYLAKCTIHLVDYKNRYRQHES